MCTEASSGVRTVEYSSSDPYTPDMLSDIPTDLLKAIFDFLKAQDLYYLSLVGRRFRALVADPAIWRGLYFSDTIKGYFPQPTVAMAEAVRPNRRPPYLQGNFLWNLATRCIHVQELKVKSSGLKSENKWLTDEMLVAFTAQCPRLRKVDLENCSAVTEIGLIVAMKNCTHLEKISLTCKNFTNALGIEIANNHRNIRTFKLVGKGTFDDFSLRQFYTQPSPHLRKLNLRIYKTEQRDPFSPICATFFFENQLSLEDITFEGCTELNDHVMNTIATSNSTTLRRLTLYGCKKMTSSALNILANMCQKLESLTLIGMKDPGEFETKMKELTESQFLPSLNSHKFARYKERVNPTEPTDEELKDINESSQALLHETISTELGKCKNLSDFQLLLNLLEEANIQVPVMLSTKILLQLTSAQIEENLVNDASDVSSNDS